MTEIIQAEGKKNFDFVDTIRCIAMMAIVWEHCVYNGTYIFNDFSIKHIVYIGLIQLSKFGTIAFFILAGFLLGNKFFTYSSWQYFKRRLSTVFVPWLIWSCIFIATILIQQIILRKGEFDFVKFLLEKIEMTYLYTNYWFIINFLFCIGLLLIFRKYLYQWWLGLVFFTFSLVYSLNIYYQWFPPVHTTAIFGFVFYLWLGALINNKWNWIEQKIKVTSYLPIILMFLLAYLISIFDIIKLIDKNSVDPYNTLRASNILYSFSTLILLFKIREFRLVKFIRPRETTFGVYLIHYILVTQLLPEVFRPFNLIKFPEMNLISMFLYVVCRFVIVYLLTLLIINFINQTRFRWIIGG